CGRDSFASGTRVPRIRRRLRAGLRLHGARRSTSRGVAQVDAAIEGPGGLRRHRRRADGHLSGRNPWRLASDRPQPGSSLRSEPIESVSVSSRRSRPLHAHHRRRLSRDDSVGRRVMASMTVVKPGMLTTVQDLGRQGYQSLGVPVAGPMDWYSHRLANRILSNDTMAAALEVTLMGPELIADVDVVMAAAGADFEITVDGRQVDAGLPFVLPSGATLRFGARRRGARA